MKVLVVGGSGFLGKHFLLQSPENHEVFATYTNNKQSFLDYLKKQNLSTVVPVELNLQDPSSIERLIKIAGDKFDLCFYTFGNSNIGESTRFPNKDLQSNTDILVSLLEKIQINKLIYMSSGSVYEGYKGLIHPALPVNPTIPYSICKLSSERYIEYFQRRTNHLKNYLNLRFFGAYGFMEPARKIYTNLVKTFGIEQSNEFTISGDGKNYIDAMYIDDAIRGIWQMFSGDKWNMTLDYCVGAPLTINELIFEAAKIFSIRDLNLIKEGATAEYTTFYASNNEVKALFNIEPQWSLAQGLRQFKSILTTEGNNNDSSN